MEGTTWANGLTLMVAGMVVVYILLIIMIFSMKAMAALMPILEKIIPENITETQKASKNKNNTNSENEIVAAIVAAKLIGK